MDAPQLKKSAQHGGHARQTGLEGAFYPDRRAIGCTAYSGVRLGRVTRDRNFEPGFLQRRVCKLSVPLLRTRGREDLGIKLENVTLDMLGRAKRVLIEKENTTIIDGAGDKDSPMSLGRIVPTTVSFSNLVHTLEYERRPPI
jgi:hypothetical protein